MKKEHILIIRFSALGDVAMAVPVVYSLAKTYPQVRITVLSRGFARPFFEDLAPNVNFMEADIKGEYRGIKGLNALYRRLVAKKPTAVADFHGVLRSAYLRMRFNLERFRVAHINKHRNERRALTSATAKRMVQLPTSFENYANVLARLGYPVDLKFTSIFGVEKGNLNLLPAAIGPHNSGEQWIGIAPFAAHKGKVYPPERMERVIDMIKEKYPHSRIFLFGRGIDEDRTFTSWCSKHGRCLYVGKHLESMYQELVLMSNLDVIVSMDSANMHMASITGTPVVSVWGATHPYAGFMGWHQSEDNAVQLPLACRPCSIFGNRPCRRGDFACMTGITPEMIFEKIDKLLTL